VTWALGIGILIVAGSLVLLMQGARTFESDRSRYGVSSAFGIFLLGMALLSSEIIPYGGINTFTVLIFSVVGAVFFLPELRAHLAHLRRR
jgi:hypothetical protein